MTVSLASSIVSFLSFLTLLADVGLVAIIVFALFPTRKFRAILLSLIRRHALLISFTVVLASLIGSLILSDGVGFEPCVLCWYQRIFLYPQVILFAIALKKKDERIFAYALPLSFIGGLIALYQSYVQWGGVSVLPCTAQDAECSKIFFTEFGYITIPVMSLTAFLWLIVVGWIKKTEHRV